MTAMTSACTPVTATKRTSRAASPGVSKKVQVRPESKENSVVANTAVESQKEVLKKTKIAAIKETAQAAAKGAASSLHMRFGSRRMMVVLVLVVALVAVACFQCSSGLLGREQLDVGVAEAQRFVTKVRSREPPRACLAAAGCVVATIALGAAALFGRRLIQARKAKTVRTA